MTRIALAVVITTAGVAAMVQHKRPAPSSSATIAPVIPLDRAARFDDRPPLQNNQRRPVRPRRPRLARHVFRHDLDWRALAYCEATGNPRAVSPDGRYLGLYQFDIGTWRSVGGRGNPADASPAEQTYRAELLYAQRGRAPWPVCGSRL